jgi:ArsR family transcriptional regulator
MQTSLRQKLNLRTKVFKALAHPSRLIVVEALTKQSRCVGELTDLIGADVSTVSKHLSVLKNAGVVQDEGAQVYYSRDAMRTELFCVRGWSGGRET